MWYFWSFILDERLRLSRMIAIPSVLFGLLIFVYGLYAPDSKLIGTLLALGCIAFAVGIWMLGDWWKARRADNSDDSL